MKGLLWFLTAVWFIGSWYWYVCPHKEVCPWVKNNLTTELPAPPTVKEKIKQLGPLTFNWSKAAAMTGDHFPTLRDSLRNLLENDDRLEITGKYFGDEENTSSYDNLGLARAAAIRDLFPANLRDRIELKGDLMPGSSTGAKDSPFEAASFRRIVDNSSVREIEGKMVIKFPHASADMLENRELINYLDDVVARLKKNSTERIDLVGHTDSSASAARNMRLGMQRAEAIKKILVDKGLSASRISTSSKGESQPIASNSTQVGMQENRRVELTITD